MSSWRDKRILRMRSRNATPPPPASKNGVNLSESNTFQTTDATRQTEIDPLPSYFQTELLLKIP